MKCLTEYFQAVHEVIVPLLPSYFGHLEESLSDCSSANAVVKSDAQKVNGALLVSVLFLSSFHLLSSSLSNCFTRCSSNSCICGRSNEDLAASYCCSHLP